MYFTSYQTVHLKFLPGRTCNTIYTQDFPCRNENVFQVSFHHFSFFSLPTLELLIGQNPRAQYCQFQEDLKYTHKTSHKTSHKIYTSQPRPAFCKAGPLLIKSRISDYPTQLLSSVTSFLSATLIACFIKKLLILHSASRHQMLPALSDLSMTGKSTTRSLLQYF